MFFTHEFLYNFLIKVYLSKLFTAGMALNTMSNETIKSAPLDWEWMP